MDIDDNVRKITATEVLVFDSSTFIREAGLTSEGATALRHYLYDRGIQLVVPQVVVEECERNLSKRADKYVENVHGALDWLARFCGRVSGWTAPTDAEIAARVMAVARGSAFDAVVVNETEELRQRAEGRRQTERPPSHRRDSLGDCRVWEQCLELLQFRDVILVSSDGDFCGHRHHGKLHPQLWDEADSMAGGNLTFHSDMASLLSGLKAEIPQLPGREVLTFVYGTIGESMTEFETNSGGFQPTLEGTVEQQLFTTDSADVVEVRLKVDDPWRLAGREETLSFRLSGTCRYRLAEHELCDLSVARVGLYEAPLDGPERAVKGSVVNISASFFAGVPSITPKPVAIRSETTLARRESNGALSAGTTDKRGKGAIGGRSQDSVYGGTDSAG